jgi:hypothetical protein
MLESMQNKFEVCYKQERTYWGRCEDRRLREIYRKATVALVEGVTEEEVRKTWPEVSDDVLERCRTVATSLRQKVSGQESRKRSRTTGTACMESTLQNNVKSRK